MNKKLVIGLAGAAGLALAVSGCGGGAGEDGADTAAAQPAAAQPATIAKALAYIVEQKSLPSTDIDPQALRQTLPVADDTIEPSPV
ncbi:MAG: hypothetical protein H7Z10_06745 [Gemmatimonadaceae bacterium]|nr:hypothetical protein [Acetobacteraceae bacterium]